MTPSKRDFVAAVRSDADQISAVVRTTDLDTPVAACPGWALKKLVGHTGTVHRWATEALIAGEPPAADLRFGPTDDDNLAVWIVDGATALAEALESADAEADTWHPFTLEQKAWVWHRRMALETAMHRWDAQTAAGIDATLDAELSSAGIHEYLEMGLPRAAVNGGATLPAVSLHVHCTDVDGEWLIWNENGTYRMLPVHDKGDAAIRGTAADIWLLLMGRIDRSALDIVGDATAADAWLDLPAW